MEKIDRILVVLCVMMTLNMLISSCVRAKFAVELIADPDIRTIPLEAGPKKITITARTNQEHVQFTWSLNGPGNLVGTVTEPGITYIPPKSIKGTDVQATVTVTITNDQGEAATASLLFTLNESPALFVKCPSETKTLEEVQKILPEHLQHYTTFKNEESQGLQRNKEIIGALEKITCDLKAIESILEKNYPTRPPEILEKIQKTQNIRKQYEQEWLDRLNQ